MVEILVTFLFGGKFRLINDFAHWFGSHFTKIEPYRNRKFGGT